jgi:poly(3-hydroxybutyrate) depolymerase
MMEVKRFPANMSEISIDRQNLRKCLVSGLYVENVEMNGVQRHFYTYLTPGLTYDQRCIIVAPPSEMTAAEYLEQSPWKTIADKEKLFLHILEPLDHAWCMDGTDADYMNKVYVQVQARDYYVTMQDNIYAAGVGDGAAIAQQAAMKMTSEWSGLMTFGDMDSSALLNAEVTLKSEDAGKVELSLNAVKCQLPVWMVWNSDREVHDLICDYWKKQNDVSNTIFSSGAADEIYFPNPVYKISDVNEEKIAQVRVTNHWDGNLTEILLQEVWGYIRQNGRHRCFGSKAMRRLRDPEEYGAKLHSMEIDGFTRIWYEYVPERVKQSGKKAPLVITMHGRGGSAETFFDLSGMSAVAEERDFIAIFPESGVYQQKKNGLRNVLAWNGSYCGNDIDDVKFIKQLLMNIKGRYNIDSERIYACGQSSGGMMTASLAASMPEVFAAVSPWSALRDPDCNLPVPEKIDPAVPHMFLLGENDWLCVDKKNGQLEYQVTKEIAEYLQNLIQLYQLYERPQKYRCGEITYYIYRNAKQVPMLIVGTVRDMSHANYPRESWIAYDQFFARFSKKEDGTLLYMGENVI